MFPKPATFCIRLSSDLTHDWNHLADLDHLPSQKYRYGFFEVPLNSDLFSDFYPREMTIITKLQVSLVRQMINGEIKLL